MRSGRRSVRLKVFVLLVVPLISVIALWAFAASVTVGDARQQLRTNAIANNLVLPIAAVQNQLAPEGLLSVVAMGTHRPADRQALAVQRARTDGAFGLLRTAIGSDQVRTAIKPQLRQELDRFLQRMTRLTEIRGTVNDAGGQRLQVVAAFGNLAEIAEALQEDIGVATLVDVELYRSALPLYTTGTGTALLSTEQAILIGAAAAGATSLNAAETEAFTQAVYNRRLLLEKLVAARVTPALGGSLPGILTSAPYVLLSLLEDRIVATPAGTPIAVDPKVFQSVGIDVQNQYAAVSQPLGLGLADQAEKAARPVLLRLALAGGLGLVAVLLSLLVSFRFGRGLAKELTALQRAAHDLAERRLPRIIERLRNDEKVDVEAEVPPLDVGETTEVARVGSAFTTVQRTAVEAAIGQANLRRGVRQVFLNLARRNQSLLHRQLAMLDSMERKTSDPDALEELFRLDHLTTRMRRHAEGLIILSGALPARAWSTPVRVVDVVRAAIAEVESYPRVRVYVLSEASLQGAAVADVTHLIAELVENAASFSPPHTQVQVRAQGVSNGFVVEIEDSGLGMSPEQLAEVNERLAKPPDFDLADTDRLGLFVVAQLAARHGIRITLRTSPYGGTTAIVLLPAPLIVQDAVSSGPDTDARWDRTASRRGPGGAAPAELDHQLPAIVDVGPGTPALTGRHRRLAGFLQRTRELQAPPAPREPADRPANGTEAGAGTGPGHNGHAGRNGGHDRGHGAGRGADQEAGRAAGASPGRPAGDASWTTGQPAGPAGRPPGQEAGWPAPGRAGPQPPEQPAGQPAGQAAGPGWDPRQPTGQVPGREREAAQPSRPAPGWAATRPAAQVPDWEQGQPPRQAPGWEQGRPAGRPPGRDAGRDAGQAAARREPARDQVWGQRREPGWDPARAGAEGGRTRGGAKFDLWATTESAGTSAGTHAGLPRRVRRASLAPQLRDTPAPGPDDVNQNTDTLRSPEQARALMTSLQQGWQRARTEPDQGPRPTEETR